MSDPIYIIGIDLGTTNSVVAYTDTKLVKGKKPDIKVFGVPQIVSAGTIEERDIIPSFILIPNEHEVAKKGLLLPWNNDCKIAVGEFARERGTEIPQHLISSSKSWLCNNIIDRNKPILPWASNDTPLKKSPIEASAAILEHIKDAWNYKMAKENDKLRIENQDILLAVPASFDAVARDLTIKACEMAGLTNVTLIEEPQAAFYSWIESSKDKWRENIKKGDLVLVCDIGGGTTDFSLIQVSEENGELVLERTSVGDHLLVGGDNMDLALAYSVSNRLLGKKVKLDSWQMRALSYSCRKAKEKLLSDLENKDYPLAILGRGSSLIGGTIKTVLNKIEIEQVILDGFFPKCEKSSKIQNTQKIGLKEFGLSYEADPAVTKHLAKFLGNRESVGKAFEIPTVVLFNGGVMKSSSIRKRVIDVLSSWADKSNPVVTREIESYDLDLAVAKGAAYYGLARRGQGVRIRGGLPKSYYIGVAASLPAVPGMPIPMKAVCIGHYGMEEGTKGVLTNQEIALLVGEPVKFDFLASSIRMDDPVGTIIEDWETDIEKITTIETTLEGEYGAIIPVIIEIKVTEIGTLELWCVSRDGGKRWKLEFNVREKI